jgi:hypothetical protein
MATDDRVEFESRASQVKRTPSQTSRPLTIAAIAALAIAAGILAWMLIGRDDDETVGAAPTELPSTMPTTPAETITQPAIQTAAQLRVLAQVKGTPIYWAGRRGDSQLEVSQTSTGTIYVRYLPKGAAAGDVTPYLTIATYDRPNGFQEVQSAAETEGTETISLENGGLAVYDPRSPTNVHLAFPGQSYQIEVYEPTGVLAANLVRRGAIRPVG